MGARRGSARASRGRGFATPERTTGQCLPPRLPLHAVATQSHVAMAAIGSRRQPLTSARTVALHSLAVSAPARNSVPESSPALEGRAAGAGPMCTWRGFKPNGASYHGPSCAAWKTSTAIERSLVALPTTRPTTHATHLFASLCTPRNPATRGVYLVHAIEISDALLGPKRNVL